MRLSSGKRIGQSGPELAQAAFFALFLHGIFLAAAVFLYVTVTPRKYVPPLYNVNLVALPAESEAVTRPAPVVPPPKPAPKPEPRKKAVQKKAPAEKKTALPELASPRPKPAEEPVQEQPQEAQPQEPAPPARAESVAVATPQQDFKFGWYIARVRDKIGRNWNPPADARDAKCRVVFSVNRSGWVGLVNLDEENSSGSFGFKQAAVRAIRASNPFPPLPEEFAKQTLEFTVDLIAIE